MTERNKEVQKLEGKVGLMQGEVNRYQEFIHDLLENYSLPENLVEELEHMRMPR